MNENRSWTFNYQRPEPLSETEGKPDFAAFERKLKAKLDESGGKSITVLKGLAWFYSSTRRYQEALQWLQVILKLETDVEAKASCILALGQATEQLGDFAAAAVFYREAFALKPTRTELWYLINNNLGYCLNKTGEHLEAEQFCRAAIAINPQRPDAHDNLGVALAGQGHYPEAARCFLRAAQRCPNDPRATEHLRELLEQHPELQSEFLCGVSPSGAGERASQGVTLKVLIGCSELTLTQQMATTLEAVFPGSRVEVQLVTEWNSFLRKALSEPNDLVIMAPEKLGAAPAAGDVIESARKAMLAMAPSRASFVIVLLEHGQLPAWRGRFRKAGVDAVMPMPLAPNAFAEVVKRLMLVPK